LKSATGTVSHSLLTYLGRVWLQRGRDEKNIPALRTALDYARRAADVAHGNVHALFNVAYIQFQIAEVIRAKENKQRTVSEIEQAIGDLDAAIKSINDIAKAKNPPFPREDLQQRATMGKNTLRRQLERALQQQREYETTSQAKLDAARRKREEEAVRKNEELARREEAKAEEQRRLGEQRRQLMEKELEWRRKEQEAAHTAATAKNSDSDDSDDDSGAAKPKARKRKSEADTNGSSSTKKRKTIAVEEEDAPMPDDPPPQNGSAAHTTTGLDDLFGDDQD